MRVAAFKPTVAVLLTAFLLPLSSRASVPVLPTIPTNVFNITNYGAVGNGTNDNTTSIQNAINAASSRGGGIVEVPAGTFSCGPIVLASSIDLRVDAGALLQMLPYGTWPAASNQFIYCKNVHDVAISGTGTIDGQGSNWWVAYNNNNNLSRPLLAQLYSVNRLFIHDVTMQNPPYHHCGIRDNGGNVTISNLTENAPSTSPNTDGIDFVATNSLIENCHINVGDDNVALGSTGPLIDLVISNCAFGNGHGVSIGSGITDGISNLTVINCSFNGTVNGIRIKASQDASGPATNLNYFNLSMTNVELPIVIYSYYNITGTPTSITPTQVLTTAPGAVNATTPRWSGITISNLNIVAGASSRIGGIIWGPTEWPISNLTLIHITNNAPGTFDLYNVYGAQIIDSQFNFSGGNTFTLCNAGLLVTNSSAVVPVESIGGATSLNSLALGNASASITSTNLFGANPVTVTGCVLTDSGNLALPAGTVQNFSIGSSASTIAATGSLSLGGTVNLSAAAGFASGAYTLFTYGGALSGLPALGNLPAGYNVALDTSRPGKVIIDVSGASNPVFGSINYVPGNNSIVVSGSGGSNSGTYRVLTSTNATASLKDWIPIATNQFNAAGQFTFTNLVAPNLPQQYFLLGEP